MITEIHIYTATGEEGEQRVAKSALPSY